MVGNQKALNGKKFDFLVVGAGLAGAVTAERIAGRLKKKVLVIDKRPHIGGNCYDCKDKNGILVQKYGPHIFHTGDKKVFYYLSLFTGWHNYKHKVLSFHKGHYYPMPADIKTTGLYEAFIKNYTQKQWGMPPGKLDKSILNRIPLRRNKGSVYFKDKYQGVPKSGYSKMINGMLRRKNITVMLNKDFFKIGRTIKYKKLIYTGPIDKFFDYKFGRLQYRAIRFSFETHDLESYQPNSVVNFPDLDAPYTRITEFKKFYSKRSSKTVICKEFPCWEEEPAYPVINRRNTALLKKYLNEAKRLKDVIFIGRLAQYRYLDMDETIKEALKVFEEGLLT